MSVVQYGVDDQRIAWITINDPASSITRFGAELLNELELVLEELAAQPLTGLIVASGKPDSFLGDMDPALLAGLRGASFATALARGGQRVFQRLASFPAPTVAAIHGACIGAGCELALACQYRVATEDPATRLALPATSAGLIPCWGGSQRLPRLIGLRRALDFIVSGREIGAVTAWELGLVDKICLPRELTSIAPTLCRPGRRRLPLGCQLENWPPMRQFICRQTRRSVGRLRVSPRRTIDTIERGLAQGLPSALETEAQTFAELIINPEWRHLDHIATLREKLAAPEAVRFVRRTALRKVGVVGAGALGAAIAQWCAARGLLVRLYDVSTEAVAAGMKRIAEADRKTNQAGWPAVRPTVDWSGFGNCEVVIAAMTSDAATRRRVWTDLGRVTSRECVLASAVEEADLEDWATVTDRAAQCVGLYWARPVSQAAVVEVVRGARTGSAAAALAVALVKQIGKLPVLTAGPVTARLVACYAAAATELLREQVAPGQIDTAMVEFGMRAGPVGLVRESGVGPAVKPLRTKFPMAWIQKRVLEALIAEGQRCRREQLVLSDDDLDALSVWGLGFPAWRGGLATYAQETLGGVWRPNL